MQPLNSVGKATSVMNISSLLGAIAMCSLISMQASSAETVAGSGKAPAYSIAGFFPGNDSSRKVFSFNDRWKYLKGDSAGAEKPEFDDAAWETVYLPHGLEILPENASGMRNYQGPAWYRKHFTTDKLAPGERTTLYFEAVMGKSKVWVNGRLVAEHWGGYLPFAADVTDVLNPPGQDNVVAVWADNADDPLFPPGKPQGDLDFTYFGGIYRDVYLIRTAGVHVTLPELSPTVAGGGVFVAVKDVSASSADLEVRTEVRNDTAIAQGLAVRTTLEDQEHRPLVQQLQSTTLAPGKAQQFVQALRPQNPHLWNLNDPYLHYILTEVIQNGRVVDSQRTRFGIRLFELKGEEGLFINKKPVGHPLIGVNRHQDYVYVGNALPKSGQWRDAQMLREGGSTVIRAAHYPLSPAFMDACDELGLLVTVANPGWQFYNKAPIFSERVVQDSHQMVRRDRNRPSVILWETTLNEAWDLPPDLLPKMHKAVHEEFPFPGCFSAADEHDARGAGLDVVFKVRPPEDKSKNSFTREFGDWVENFWDHNSPVRINREWGERALQQQATLRAEQLNEFYRLPLRHFGATLWAGIDHQRGYHPDPFWGGLLDVYRVPRYSYYLFKSQYDPDLKVPGISTGPMVYISHELTPISGSDVVVYTNCEEVRLSWLGKEVGTIKADPSKGSPHPPVVFKDAFNFRATQAVQDVILKDGKAEMVAEGLIGGKVVCRTAKPYPRRVVGLKLELDGRGIPLTADGADFVPVRCYVVDKYGTAKVLDESYIKFAVEGPGSIIGGEANHANPMKLEFGVATALVRAGTTPGKIRVTATTEGLKPASLEIESIAPALPTVAGAAK